MGKRHLDCLILSDIHLGTGECRAQELADYLKSINPARVVLNGDIVDLMEIRRGVWPDSHHQVVRRLLKFAQKGIPVHWIAGNHDAALRRLLPVDLGHLQVADRLELTIGGQRVLIVHGDHLEGGTPAWLRALGTWLYDGIQCLVRGANHVRDRAGRERWAAGPLMARHVPWAGRHLERFEQAAVDLARDGGFDAIAVGHVHVPAMRPHDRDGRPVLYLNSGDWVDSCSALEFGDGSWRVVTLRELRASGQVVDNLMDTVAVA